MLLTFVQTTQPINVLDRGRLPYNRLIRSRTGLLTGRGLIGRIEIVMGLGAVRGLDGGLKGQIALFSFLTVSPERL